MPTPHHADRSPARSRAVTWLRVLKLVLTILLLVTGLLEALHRLGVAVG